MHTIAIRLSTLFVLLRLLWPSPVAATPVAPPDPQPVAATSPLQALQTRLDVAEARNGVRRRHAAGQGSLAEAYRDLSAASLGDRPLLQGRLTLIQQRAIDRARERVADPPAELDPEALGAWRSALAKTLEAEAAADQMEEDLIVSVLGWLSQHPELTAEALSWLTEPLRGAAAIVAAPGPDTDADLRQLIEAEAARADRDLAALEALLIDLRLVGTGRPVPDPAPDLARLDDPEQAVAAADRLALLQPLLAEGPAARVEAALAEHYAARLARAEVALAEVEAGSGEVEGPLPILEQAAAAAERQRRAAAARATALGEGDGLRARLVAVELDLAEARLAAAETRVAIEQGEVTVELAQTEADLAQAEADAAQAAAADARDRRLADALSDFAAARARSTTIQVGITEVTDRIEAHEETVDRIAGLQRQVERVMELSTLSADRPDTNKVYRDLRHVLGELRASSALRGERVVAAQDALSSSEDAIVRDRQRLEAARGLLQSLEGPELQKLQETLAAWDEGLEQERVAARRWVDLAQQERDTLFTALQHARVAKRDLYPYISSDLRQEDSSMLVNDIAQEVQLLVPSVWSRVRGRALDLLSAPSLLTNWNVLWSLITGSFWSLMSGLFWWWGRSRAKAWALQVAARVRQVRPELRPVDVVALRDPLARAIRNTIDLLLGTLLLWSLGDGLPELQFLVSVYLYLSTYRVLLAGFDLVVVPNTQVRPALWVMAEASYDLARQTVQLFLAYAIVSRLLDFLLWDALGLDTLAGLVRGLMTFVFWLLVALTLYQWEPISRARLARRTASPNPLIAWLRVDGHWLLRVPRAVGQIVFFGAVVASDLSNRLAQEGTSLTWLFNLLSRYRLKEEDPAQVQLISREVRARVVGGDTPDKHRIVRNELDQIPEALEQWRATGQRGLVALVGDRGVGKATSAGVLEQTLTGGDLQVHRGTMPEDMRTERQLFGWLGDVFGFEGRGDTDEMVERIKATEARIVILEGVHRCFARRVDGVDLMQTLLYLLNATSDHHFYVVSLHEPTWDYMSAVGSMVDCGVFRTVVRLAPMTSGQLRSLTLARTGSAGLQLDFSGLRRHSALGGDPEVELERSIGVFYRLLAEASGGSPTVALELFARCLQPTDDPERVRVVMGGALSMMVLPNLSDDALFVLVALNLHETLRPDELAEVTNLGMSVVRAILRDLQSRDLVERSGDLVTIPDRHRVAVQRTLRRRHFLHLGTDR